MTSNENADGLEQLEALCKKICHILEREHSVLCARNGLIGRGVDELELLHNEKDSELERLELLARNVDFAECAKVVPFRAREVRDSVERCKNLRAKQLRAPTILRQGEQRVERVVIALIYPEIRLKRPKGQ